MRRISGLILILMVSAIQFFMPAARAAQDDLMPGKVFKDCADCPDMVVIPAGSFQMGSPPSERDRYSDEGPTHQVTFAKPFAMGRTEVTQKQWRSIMASDPSNFKKCDDCPVEKVTWKDTQEYLKKLSEITGRTYRLPTEAEWEYAARAGTKTTYHTGNCIQSNQANYDGNYSYGNCDSKYVKYWKKPVPVASYPANGFGLYDMLGNVWEWGQDCYHGSYIGAPADGSAWEGCDSDIARVLRGGSWNNEPQDVRSASRSRGDPNSPYNNYGFRVARTLF